MALIACEDCGTQVSDKAETCVKCGCPITTLRAFKATDTHINTIQETAKRFKLQLVLSGLLFAVAMVAVFVMPKGGDQTSVAVLLALIGLIWHIIIKIKVWWHHK